MRFQYTIVISVIFIQMCLKKFLITFVRPAAESQMGREWLYWGSGSGTSNKSTSQRGGRRRKGELVMNNINEEATPPPGGCMCFQIFDLPHFQLALNQQSRSLKPHHHSSFLKPDPEPSLLKGN